VTVDSGSARARGTVEPSHVGRSACGARAGAAAALTGEPSRGGRGPLGSSQPRPVEPSRRPSARPLANGSSAFPRRLSLDPVECARRPSTRSGSPARGARARAAAALTVEPSRGGRPACAAPWNLARIGGPPVPARPVEHAPGTAAVLTVAPRARRKPGPRGWGSPARGVHAKSRSGAHRPLSRSVVRQVAGDTAGRNSAAARRYVAREAGTRRVSTRQRRGDHPPQGGRGRQAGITWRLLLFPVAAL
jgi:hypothetical protein